MNQFAIKWLSRHVLNFSSQIVKNSFRKLECENRKLINNEEHLNFNEICLRENLLPKYTNFKLHDAAARQEDFVMECRRQLTERQIQSKKTSIEQIKQDITRTREQLRYQTPTEVRFAALEMFLKRLMDQHRFNVVSQHDKKLSELYNGTVLRKQKGETYVNLSNVSIGEDIEKIFSGQIDKIIIAPLLGFTALGNYHLGFQFLGLLLILPGLVYTYTLPRDASGIATRKVKIITIIVSVGISILGITLAPIILPEFFPQFEEVIEVVQILSLYIIPNSITTAFSSHYLGKEKSKFVIIGQSIAIGVYLVGIFTLGEIYGITGIAVSFVLSGVVQTIYYLSLKKFRT